jgi:5'-methylthioadenosine phosphorylase
MNDQHVLGIIGGSGLYGMAGMAGSETIDMDTPFGKPSAPIVLGTLGGKRLPLPR